MLLHEKMRLQRKQTKLTLKQLRNGNMLSKMESKIKRREKYYAKLDKQIDSQATRYKNQMQMVLNEQYGSNFGGGYGGFASGLNSIFSCPAMANMNIGDKPKGVSDELLNYVMQGGGFTYVDEKTDKEHFKATMDETITGVTQDQINQCKAYVNKFRMAQSQMQGMVQQMKTAYEQQIEDWKTYQKEQLEMQQEYEMDLLAEEQTEYEAEKEGIAAELELVKQRKEAIEQELGQSIKDAAPKFGLA